MEVQVFGEQEAIAAGIYVKESVPKLSLTPHSRSKWKLTADARYCVDIGDKWITAIVESGFICDLDSVPRTPILHAWLKARTVTAAVLHDALYKNSFDRKQSDRAFLRAMELEGVKKRYRLPIYWAVRLFGGTKFKEKAKAKIA